MSTNKGVLRVMTPNSEWTPPSKLKLKTNNQITPLSHKNHKRVGSSCYWKLCAKADHLITSKFSPSSLDKKHKFDRQNRSTCDVPSPLTLTVSPCTQEVHEKYTNSPISLQLPQYLNVPSVSITKLPLSPSMFECPLTTDSPNFQYASPLNEFLYTPDRCGYRLGRGSYGSVTLCKYRKRPFALKVLHCPNSASIGEKHLVGVRHAHLVTVLKVVQLIDTTFIFMDFAGHCNLQQLLDNKADLLFLWRLRFAQQIASGLNHCHRLNIVHGDVKPINVIVDPKGTCKLGDFGSSTKLGIKKDNKCYRDDGFTGTAAYAAPEILKGETLSLEADIYSFGITLWQIYTNETPFAGEHPHVIIYKVVSSNARPVFEKPINDSIKEEYINLSTTCWDKNPLKRPVSEKILTNLINLLALLKINATKRVG